MVWYVQMVMFFLDNFVHGIIINGGFWMGGYGYIHLQIDCVYLQNDQTMTWGWGIELDISETRWTWNQPQTCLDLANRKGI
jgi:hypothetical protein